MILALQRIWVGGVGGQASARFSNDLKTAYCRTFLEKKIVFSCFSSGPFSACQSRWYFVFSSWDGSHWHSCSVTASLSLEFVVSSNPSSCCGYAVLEFHSLFKSIQLNNGK